MIIAFLGILGSTYFLALMTMGGGGFLDTKMIATIKDCPYYSTNQKRDTCYIDLSRTVNQCKSIIDTTLEEKCITNLYRK